MYTPMSVFNTPDCKCFLILRGSELQVFLILPKGGKRYKTNGYCGAAMGNVPNLRIVVL